ncbi:flagellar hook-length control protein FliK [Ruegeria conchae]|uniref:Flagellar hook-length control protein FliK n=1 Tax=Ruegeria conchae TaxID=981384 RepID=A0A497ZBH6_9RHOB|nr:flagellar hook-length control protein FliK [Ruegeria conchae]RLK00507.1 flagellar hook-length control protein FliK [Ruegeria conchae]
MSNPLTVLTASTTTGSKSDAQHGGARENKGAQAFEDVMNEEAELNDPESLPTISKQKVAVEEQPDVEINDSVRTTVKPLSQNGDEELPNPEAAFPQLLTLADSELQAPRQSEIAVPSPAVDPVSNQNISTSPTDQTNRSTTISSTTPAASEIPPAPEQKSDKVEKRVLTRTLGRSGISPDSNARPFQSRNSTEVGIRPDLDTPIASVFKVVSQQQTASATNALISAQATNIAPVDTIREPATVHEILDIPTLKEATIVPTQRETMGITPFIPHRAEYARAIAGQLAAVISARPGVQGVDIALNPEELGRVSITLTNREDGLHLMIMTERPETLDLMRRHIALLSAEFEKLGYQGMSLDLGLSGNTAEQEKDPEAQQFSDTSEVAVDEFHNAPIVQSGPRGGLDVRL